VTLNKRFYVTRLQVTAHVFRSSYMHSIWHRKV